MGTTKMKGIFKGIRYISNIFEIREEEMVIGFPTDVKHIAHIGCDSHSSTTAPNWMKEFEQTYPASGGSKPTSPKEYRRRPSGAKSSPIESSGGRGYDSPKHCRRHRSSGGEAESPLGDEISIPSVPKRPSRRKSKGQNTGGEKSKSSRRSRRSSSTESLPDDPKIHHIHSNSLPQPRKSERVKGPSRSARISKEPSDPTGSATTRPNSGDGDNSGRGLNEDGENGELDKTKDTQGKCHTWVPPTDKKTTSGDYCSVVDSSMALALLY